MEKMKITDAVFNSHIKKDYTHKIKAKLYVTDIDQKSEDINRLIILFNYCFHTRNGFFIDKFNKSFIKDLNQFYHQLKTNILTDNNVYTDVKQFINIDTNIDDRIPNLIRFILKQYLLKYDVLRKENNILTNEINDRDVLRILSYLK